MVPLIAVKLNILTRKTLGGFETDLDSRVFGRNGRIMPGLYAAGEAAGFGGGGMHGYRSLEGTFLGGCLFYGPQCRCAPRRRRAELINPIKPVVARNAVAEDAVRALKRDDFGFESTYLCQIRHPEVRAKRASKDGTATDRAVVLRDALRAPQSLTEK